MKSGDMVRFPAPHWLGGAGVSLEQRPILVGLLVKYETWEKIAEILYNGEVLRIAAREVEKAGRKDLQREKA
tara:strand:+ start:446 stop:661 length:216 start_codon:yes stop_codon:yes gene_type:complete